MNILITAPNLDPSKNVSGISSVVKNIIDNNTDHKYFHYILGRDDRKHSFLYVVFIQLYQILYFPFYLTRYKIDIVHQNFPFNPKGILREFVINTWCYIFRIPVMLHIHGGEYLMRGTSNKLYLKLINFIFTNSRKIVVLSELEKITLQEKFNYRNATILENSIDVEQYKVGHSKNLSSKPLLLFIGRIHESKGIEDIVGALILLKSKYDFKFILCGIGPLKDFFIDQCQNILQNDFEYRGVVKGLQKAQLIKEAEIFLLPSRYGEGLPIALLETMAAGVVPIVTDDASMKYIVEDENTCIRVKKRDPQDIYRALSNLLDNPLLFSKVSYNAAKLIDEKYNIKLYIKKLNDIYKSCMTQFE
ncbi:glycosyltransferase family 4 protein [Siphonobacter sp. SORGH_AS_1065]|uniref:glycosyltransferase family 4 protein n=1 Tax=Siphonobacter sp. SORGH_AS_1065 TaxID=3041795 RepID=UPI002787516A|nr:glycosyltransferase family 4 protein [Siphonobacter sp. SORGH_AS_1065]MDQ1086632.1 glycosyltransferase involved in cell wall biosynthesis [Siphonobacter sp. SORGH_AS_1065]